MGLGPAKLETSQNNSVAPAYYPTRAPHQQPSPTQTTNKQDKIYGTMLEESDTHTNTRDCERRQPQPVMSLRVPRGRTLPLLTDLRTDEGSISPAPMLSTFHHRFNFMAETQIHSPSGPGNNVPLPPRPGVSPSVHPSQTTRNRSSSLTCKKKIKDCMRGVHYCAKLLVASSCLCVPGTLLVCLLHGISCVI